MIWLFLAAVVLVGAAGVAAGVWWGRRVDADQADRWYSDDPNREQV